MRWTFAILLLAMCLTAAIASEFSLAYGNQRTSGGGGWNGEDQFEFHTDDSYPKQDINPDANERKRLVVEWGKVSMGYWDYEADPTTWKDDDSLSQHRRLSIRGRLLIESVDGKSRQPIDWLQGVRVVVSRLPDKKHDWSRRQEAYDAEWDSTVISANGEFLATLSPAELRRPVEKEMRFQVALSLGQKEGTTITWRNTFAVLPQSVTMLPIPGPPAINETMQIINGAPSYEQQGFNPAKLVRAVNHLMPMGKEKAIHELREFLKIARGSTTGRATRVDENIDTSNNTCVFLIVRLLFEPLDPTKELPQIRTVPFSPAPAQQDKKFWPLHPVFLQDDVPFFLVIGGGMSGEPDQPNRHVDWAEKHGKIRSTPLRPLDNPMIAAGRLMSLAQTKRLYDGPYRHDFKTMFYQQAWNIIVDANSEIPKPLTFRSANTRNHPDWEERVKTASNLKIHWSEAEQKYIMQ